MSGQRRRTSYRRANVEVTDTMDMRGILDRLQGLTQNEVRIGMQGSAELAMIAGVHEYGSIKMKIPARSFIGTGKKKAQAAISKLVRKDVMEIALGSQTAAGLMDAIGEIGKERTIKNFDKIRMPALSPAYARTKEEGNKLLVSDEELRDSITYIIARKRRR